ncbi:MAG TPA: hypothetical protein VM597_26790 [Gemmataceae bacterium]|jgi:hypothetical protein|nr:hypothetical protein [Gemmataceae bacterium]
MDLIDILWDMNQMRRIRELSGEVERLHQDRMAERGDARQLADENAALRLRLGLLVRLLISKGVITAPEYAAMIAEAESKE